VFDSVWPVVRFVHLVAAILWVGGQLTLALVVRGALESTIEDPAGRTAVFIEAGRRFGRIATLVLIPVLLASGIALMWHRGVDLGVFALPGYGTTLGVKIVLALASFVLAGVHGVIAVRGNRRMSRAVGITGAVVSLVVVYLAAALVL
jgi:uncharacterized membrane protein